MSGGGGGKPGMILFPFSMLRARRIASTNVSSSKTEAHEKSLEVISDEFPNITIRLDHAGSIYQHYVFRDSVTGHKETYLIDRKESQRSAEDFDRVLTMHKSNFQKTVDNLKRRGFIKDLAKK